MDFWQALNQVIKQSGFYKKQFVFFVALFVFGSIGFFAFKNADFKADTFDEFSAEDSSLYAPLKYHIDVNKNGEFTVEGKKLKDVLKAEEDFDLFHWEVVDNNDSYINRVDVYFNLPESIKAADLKTTIRVLGIVEEYKTEILDEKTILFSIDSVGQNASVAIEVQFPKGLFEYSIWQKSYNFLVTQGVNWWILASGILMVISIIILLLLLVRRRSINQLPTPKYELDHPPSDLSPAVVSVLKTGKVSARDITATLVDLAQRGFITIYSKGSSFTFAKSNKLGSFNPIGLQKYEQILLSKIFTDSYKSTKEDIQIRIGRHIFSRKIAEVYFLVYEVVMSYGFFEENPNAIHRRYRLGGILIFFFSTLGLVATMFFEMGPEYSLFSWFALMVAAMVIVKLSSKIMPKRTSLGNETLKEWLAYDNFLMSQKQIPFKMELTEIFSKNLPYAIALGKEVEWTERFLEYPFYLPEWFSSTETMTTLDEFANGLFPLVGYVGFSLDEVHEPTVD